MIENSWFKPNILTDFLTLRTIYRVAERIPVFSSVYCDDEDHRRIRPQDQTLGLSTANVADNSGSYPNEDKFRPKVSLLLQCPYRY
jgi:hypothetical protein